MRTHGIIVAGHYERRVHIIGAGPVGLLMTALLQSMGGFSIRLYEKRPAYTRTRMVKLSPYLTADSVSAYCDDEIDGDNVSAVFEPAELEKWLHCRRAINPKLFALLQGWDQGFCRLKDIEENLSALIQEGGKSPVERIASALTVEEAMAVLQPDDIMIDCTGANSLLRDHLVPPTAEDSDSPERNTYKRRLEYAANVTFLFGRPYLCNEYCKYYKNRGNPQYKFIPAVHRIAQDAETTHVYGIIHISPEDFGAMPSRCSGDHLRENFPAVAASMDRFIEQIHQETQGEVLGEIEVIRIPLNLYRARHFTASPWHRRSINGNGNGNGDGSRHPFSNSSVFLVGDSAIGSPYFQSISLGFECAMFLADLLGRRLPVSDVYNRYELLMYKQWMRVYMRSKIIKHNKDILECLDDKFGILEKLHIY